jgi:hypothetical protein
VDIRDDKWRDPNVAPISVKTCTDAQLSDNQITLQCGDEQYAFSLQ